MFLFRQHFTRPWLVQAWPKSLVQWFCVLLQTAGGCLAVSVNICSLNHFHLAVSLQVNISSMNCSHLLAVSSQVNISSMKCCNLLAVSSWVNSSMNCSHLLAVSSQVNIGSMKCSHLLAVSLPVNIGSMKCSHLLAVSLQVNISMNCSHSLAVSSEVNTSSMKCSYSLAVSSQVNISSMNWSHLLLLAVSWQVNIGSMKCSHLLSVCSQVNISSMKCSHSLSVSSQVNIGSMNCSHLLSVSSQVSVGVFHYFRKVHNFYLSLFFTGWHPLQVADRGVPHVQRRVAMATTSYQPIYAGDAWWTGGQRGGVWPKHSSLWRQEGIAYWQVPVMAADYEQLIVVKSIYIWTDGLRSRDSLCLELMHIPIHGWRAENEAVIKWLKSWKWICIKTAENEVVIK